MEYVHLLLAHALQAGFKRLRHRGGDAIEVAWRNADLCADGHVGLQLREDTPKVLFRFAIAVLRGRVEVIDADLDRLRDSTLLIGWRATHHQAANSTAAKTENGKLQPCPAKCPKFHDRLQLFHCLNTAQPRGL